MDRDETGVLFADGNPEPQYLLLENLYFADGRPVIHARNYLPDSVLRSHDDAVPDDPQRFSQRLQNLVTEEVVQSLKHFKASKASPRLAVILEIEEGDALIQWVEDHIGIFDNLLCRSLISFHPDIVELSFLTKWK